MSFKIVKFMISITFAKNRFNNKKSRSSHPKICKIIRKKTQKPLLFKNSQNLQEDTPEIESFFLTKFQARLIKIIFIINQLHSN